MNCIKCGNKIEGMGQFCTSCGTPFISNDTPPEVGYYDEPEKTMSLFSPGNSLPDMQIPGPMSPLNPGSPPYPGSHSQPYPSQPMQPFPPPLHKKSRIVPIISIITGCIILLGICTYMVFYYNNSNDPQDNNDINHSDQQNDLDDPVISPEPTPSPTPTPTPSPTPTPTPSPTPNPTPSPTPEPPPEDPLHIQLGNVIFNTSDALEIHVNWESGEHSVFYREAGTLKWTLYSRRGDIYELQITFKYEDDNLITMQTGGTDRKYHFFSDGTGYWRNPNGSHHENLEWTFVPIN